MTHCEACYDLGAECECDRHSKTPSTTSKPVEELKTYDHENLAKFRGMLAEFADMGLRQQEYRIVDFVLEWVRSSKTDMTNINDWVNRGLLSSNSDVWFRCLQMIETESKALEGSGTPPAQSKEALQTNNKEKK